MKVKITGRGVYDAKGKLIPAGTTLTVKGDAIPAWLANKAVEVEGRVAVTNPAQDTLSGGGA